MDQNSEIYIGIAIIGFFSIMLDRAICWASRKVSGVASRKPETLEPVRYEEQTARILHDTAMSLSECVVVMRRLERLMERTEMTLGHVDRVLDDHKKRQDGEGGLRVEKCS